MTDVTAPGPHPRPGPATPSGPDVVELRANFHALLADSADAPVQAIGRDPERGAVRDRQVDALDAAHELLSQALTALDTAR